MKTVTIGFSKPKKWKIFAALIMWQDKSNISHSYTRFESPRWNSSFIYHNAGHRTNFMSGEYFEKINEVVEEYVLDVPDELEAYLGKLCVSREGLPYGILQVVGKGFVALFSLAGVRIKNPMTSDTDCVEEQAVLLKEGLAIAAPLDMNSVTVRPYRDWISQLPNVRRVI